MGMGGMGGMGGQMAQMAGLMGGYGGRYVNGGPPRLVVRLNVAFLFSLLFYSLFFFIFGGQGHIRVSFWAGLDWSIKRSRRLRFRLCVLEFHLHRPDVPPSLSFSAYCLLGVPIL